MTRRIEDLPDELLSRIFLQYVNICDDEGHWGPSRVVSYQARALLCSINHRMREVAIRFPQLWTHIQAYAGFGPVRPSLSSIELWAKRSGSLPIHVDLYGPAPLSCGHPGDTGDPERAIGPMRVLQPDLHRWKSFKIFFLDESAATFVELPLERAEILEEIEVVSSCPQELDNKLLANIAKLSALRHLMWDKYYINEDDISSFHVAVSSFPWHQLRSITLSVMMSPKEVLQMFSASTSAEAIDLKLRRNPSAPVDSTLRPLITLPNLQSLNIRSDVGIYETLQHLDLPGLKTLRLSARRFYCDGPNIACERYKEFISRAAISLQKVTLNTFDFRGDDVTEFFSNPDLLNIPNLQVGLEGHDAGERAESALKSILTKRPDVKRHLQVKEEFWTGKIIGWTDEEVKEKQP